MRSLAALYTWLLNGIVKVSVRFRLYLDGHRGQMVQETIQNMMDQQQVAKSQSWKSQSTSRTTPASRLHKTPLGIIALLAFKMSESNDAEDSRRLFLALVHHHSLMSLLPRPPSPWAPLVRTRSLSTNHQVSLLTFLEFPTIDRRDGLRFWKDSYCLSGAVGCSTVSRPLCSEAYWTLV